MKKTKKIYFLITIFFLIFVILFLNLRSISSIVKPYIPDNLYKISSFIVNNKVGILKISNDYNVKFLPETQTINLELVKHKLDFDEKTISGYYSPEITSTFYIEQFQEYLLFITKSGQIKYLKKNHLYNSKKNNLNTKIKNISSNFDGVSILDSFVLDNQIYISFVTGNDIACQYLNLSKAKINTNYLNFLNLYKSEECMPSVRSGKISIIKRNENKIIYLTTAADILNKNLNEHDPKPQNVDSIWGKVLEFPDENKKPKIFSYGHRNILGLLSYKNKLIATENGPKGGDEINILERNKNYGWDIASYGTKYRTHINDFNYKDHEKEGFQEPIFSFIPSLGISEIIKIPNNFSRFWNDNFIVGTLRGGHLLRIKFDNKFSKVLFVEKIFIGERIRDIIYLNDFQSILMALESSGSLGVLNVKK